MVSGVPFGSPLIQKECMSKVMTLDEAKEKIIRLYCSDCLYQNDCRNMDKRSIDFGSSKPCKYKRKIPKKRGMA